MAFSSAADNLVPDDGDGATDVFVRDLSGPAPVTERISVSTTGQPQAFVSGSFGFGSSTPAITGDGRFVAFHSDAVNFTTPAQTGNFSDVFVRDRQERTTELASPNADGGEANGQSQGADLSPDGRFVSFASFATDLVDPADPDFLLMDAFVHDRVTATSELVSRASNHDDATFSGFDTHVGTGPVSGDGLLSLMATNADNLFSGDDNRNLDVYANDRRPGTDLSLAKTAAPDPVAARETLSYTLTAANEGLDPAPAAGIRDTLPAGVTFTSASPGCTHISGTVDCELGTLAPGDSTTVMIVVTPKRPGTITNTAVVGSAVADPDGSDNTATVVTTVAK